MIIMHRILRGSVIQLEPLNDAHKDELYHAAQDEKIWKYVPKLSGDRFYRWFDKAIKCFDQQQHLPFIVRNLSNNKIIGSTRYYDISMENRRTAIGYTWYVPEVWGTPVNPESKLLLLSFAFDELKMNRVEFKIDPRNVHSCAAVKKLGATQEGILRQHLILDDGYIRDSVVFSIVKSDWEEVKTILLKRLRAI